MTRPHPSTAITAWWQAMQDADLAALAEVTLDDYLSSGGPGQRTVGREALLKEAEGFLGSATIDAWSISDLETREHGDVAVCAYHWSEKGAHNGAPFDFAGSATDVLVYTGDGWRYQAHHVSM